MRRLTALAFLALPLATPCAAANLLQNPSFTSNLAGWNPASPSVSASWAPRDAGGSPASGSALVSNAQPGQGSEGIVQCVPVQPDLTYAASAYVRVPSGQATPGGALILVQWYANAGCTSGFLSNAPFPREVRTTDEWQQITLTHLYPPASAKFAAFAAYPSKGASGGSFQASYDDLFFGVEAFGRTLTIPASASIHGAQGAFFHGRLDHEPLVHQDHRDHRAAALPARHGVQHGAAVPDARAEEDRAPRRRRGRLFPVARVGWSDRDRL